MAKTIDSFYLEGKKDQGVVLCHTLGGDPSQMLELGKKLNKKGYHVICPLFKGHGSEFVNIIKTDVRDWYQDVLNAYDEISTKVKDVYSVGMSIGGALTAKLAQDKDLKGICTINAPIIGFDIESDVFNFRKNYQIDDVVPRYREHRTIYFDWATKVGQIENLKKITCPIFVLQGSMDLSRYKTSSQLLMYYVNSDIKQRKDYLKSFHLILQDNDKKEAMKDIVKFIEEN